jgi:hypothetical protein
MPDLDTTIDTYLAAYSEPDPAARLPLLEQAFVADAKVIDPPIDGEGHQGISDMMTAVLQQFAGHTFRRVSGIDAHHGFARYGWELRAPDGAVALAGLDVVEVADDGQLARVIGFLGPLPEAT